MTIADLIKLLQTYDPSTCVVVTGAETDLNDVGSIEVVELEGGQPAVFLKAKASSKPDLDMRDFLEARKGRPTTDEDLRELINHCNRR